MVMRDSNFNTGCITIVEMLSSCGIYYSVHRYISRRVPFLAFPFVMLLDDHSNFLKNVQVRTVLEFYKTGTKSQCIILYRQVMTNLIHLQI